LARASHAWNKIPPAALKLGVVIAGKEESIGCKPICCKLDILLRQQYWACCVEIEAQDIVK